nr:MAG TPA: hypothetical protein [Bacteriophage sp.]
MFRLLHRWILRSSRRAWLHSIYSSRYFRLYLHSSRKG